MTPISKILSLLLTVLVVTSLFVPAVAAAENPARDAWWELYILESDGYHAGCDADGNSYDFDSGTGKWTIRIKGMEPYTIIPQSEAEAKELLGFVNHALEHERKIEKMILAAGIVTAIGGTAVGIACGCGVAGCTGCGMGAGAGSMISASSLGGAGAGGKTAIGIAPLISAAAVAAAAEMQNAREPVHVVRDDLRSRTGLERDQRIHVAVPIPNPDGGRVAVFGQDGLLRRPYPFPTIARMFYGGIRQMEEHRISESVYHAPEPGLPDIDISARIAPRYTWDQMFTAARETGLSPHNDITARRDYATYLVTHFLTASNHQYARGWWLYANENWCL